MSGLIDLIQHASAIFWALVGIALLIMEVLLIGGFYLSFSAAAFILSLLIGIGLAPESLLWKGVIFTVLGVALVPLFKLLLRKHLDKTPDINRY
jgi:membrane protein implicated in regulation of membrane protease activity